MSMIKNERSVDWSIFLKNFRFATYDYQDRLMSQLQYTPRNRQLLITLIRNDIRAISLDDGPPEELHNDLLTALYILAHFRESRAFPLLCGLASLSKRRSFRFLDTIF